MHRVARTLLSANSIQGKQTSELARSLHAERNNRLPARTSTLLQFPQQLRFHIVRIDDHLARSNLFITRAVKTKFTDSQAAFCSHGRTKRAARHRPSTLNI